MLRTSEAFPFSGLTASHGALLSWGSKCAAHSAGKRQAIAATRHSNRAAAGNSIGSCRLPPTPRVPLVLATNRRHHRRLRGILGVSSRCPCPKSSAAAISDLRQTDRYSLRTAAHIHRRHSQMQTRCHGSLFVAWPYKRLYGHVEGHPRQHDNSREAGIVIKPEK
jgi:hypothetical protein